MKRLVTLISSIVLGVLYTSAATYACTVCYGDPNSLQVKGAEAGVLVLMGVICTVLLAIAGSILFFFLRARRISRIQNTVALPTSN